MWNGCRLSVVGNQRNGYQLLGSGFTGLADFHDYRRYKIERRKPFYDSYQLSLPSPVRGVFAWVFLQHVYIFV